MLGRNELLEQLPALQQLLYRLIGCQVTVDMNLFYINMVELLVEFWLEYLLLIEFQHDFI